MRTQLFSVYEIDQNRTAIKSLFNDFKPPELQYLNLKGLITLDKGELPDNYLTTDKEIIKISDSTYRFKRVSIAEYVGFSQNALKKNRSAYPYQSKKFFNQPTTFKIRYGLCDLRFTTDPDYPDLKTLYPDHIIFVWGDLNINLRCAFCGKVHNLKLTKRNLGRDLPKNCKRCKTSNSLFISKIRQGKNTLYEFKINHKLVRDESVKITIDDHTIPRRTVKTGYHAIPTRAIDDLEEYGYINFKAYLGRL